MAGLPTYKRARLGIGRTYQRVEVFTDMSVRDHLMVAERARRGEGRLWRDLLQPEQADDRRDGAGRGDPGAGRASRSWPTPRSTRSGSGNCRLVELARALAAEPKILLADEPSSGLDLHETAEVAAVLRTVQRERGTAVLLVEHDLSMVADVVDRTVVMDLGADARRGHLRRGHGRPAGARRLPRPDGTAAMTTATVTPERCTSSRSEHVSAAYGPYRALFDVSLPRARRRRGRAGRAPTAPGSRRSLGR